MVDFVSEFAEQVVYAKRIPMSNKNATNLPETRATRRAIVVWKTSNSSVKFSLLHELNWTKP